MRVPSILARIKPPTFAAKTYPVTRFGAKGDGATDCTRAFRRAIDACANGRRRSRRRCRRRVSDRPDPSAEQREPARRARARRSAFSRTPRRTCRRVHALRGHRADGLLAAHLRVRNAINVAVTGEGTLDGQAEPHGLVAVEGQSALRMEAGRRATRPRRARGCSTWRSGACRSPSRRSARAPSSGRSFIQPYRCQQRPDRRRDDHRNSPMWEIHPVLCTNVTVRGVHDRDARSEQRRLQSGVVPRRADRALHVRHRATTASRSSRAATPTAGA